jgi:hypothetical protein
MIKNDKKYKYEKIFNYKNKTKYNNDVVFITDNF